MLSYPQAHSAVRICRSSMQHLRWAVWGCHQLVRYLPLWVFGKSQLAVQRQLGVLGYQDSDRTVGASSQLRQHLGWAVGMQGACPPHLPDPVLC